MKEFSYTVKDADGLHARPAGLMVQCAKSCTSDVTIRFNGKTADAKRIFAVMGLDVKRDNEITVVLEGPDESADCEKLKSFCEANI